MAELKPTIAPNEYFSYKVREVMRQKGLTRERVADALNISLSRFNSYLRNSNPVLPQIVTASDIAEYLGVSLDYLCGSQIAKELPQNLKITPEILLVNLYRAICDAGFSIETDENRTTLTSDNYFISLFLSQAAKMNSIDEVRNLARQYKDLYVLDHQLVHRSEYERNRKALYIYGDITDAQQEEVPEECRELIQARFQEWVQTDGHPQKYLPEGWDEQ